ncbi:Hypothetical_protein [Hexamita inflata]|uniref:Hypothetical_protein n=1 Tax=Hexamita inflata TaxID=28002 RepID=A0AA86QFQ7_9EUKA|nr:Hypothetical protein HINF_LOCUS39879 [Hexamita inflata]
MLKKRPHSAKGSAVDDPSNSVASWPSSVRVDFTSFPTGQVWISCISCIDASLITSQMFQASYKLQIFYRSISHQDLLIKAMKLCVLVKLCSSKILILTQYLIIACNNLTAGDKVALDSYSRAAI